MSLSRKLVCAVTPLLLAPSVVHGPGMAPPPRVSVKHCDEPKIPLGYLHADGVLTYSILSNGHADTATFVVLAVTGMSRAGFKSAAARLLSGCTFRVEQKSSGPVPVFEKLSFDSAQVRYALADRLSVPLPPVTHVETIAPPSRAVDETDSILDERPRMLSCDLSVNPILGPPSQGRAEVMREGTGFVRLRFVIGADGRVPMSTISVLMATNPSATQSLIRNTEDCRFAPGRVGGAPVATLVTRIVGVRTTIRGAAQERSVIVR
jgi:hypothetical protein